MIKLNLCLRTTIQQTTFYSYLQQHVHNKQCREHKIKLLSNWFSAEQTQPSSGVSEIVMKLSKFTFLYSYKSLSVSVTSLFTTNIYLLSLSQFQIKLDATLSLQNELFQANFIIRRKEQILTVVQFTVIITVITSVYYYVPTLRTGLLLK